MQFLEDVSWRSNAVTPELYFHEARSSIEHWAIRIFLSNLGSASSWKLKYAGAALA